MNTLNHLPVMDPLDPADPPGFSNPPGPEGERPQGTASAGDRRAHRVDAGSPNSGVASTADLDAAFMAIRPSLMRLAFSMTRSPEDAEDAVQEVWLRWRRHRGSVTAGPHWLRTVTRNVVVDLWRSRTTYRATISQIVHQPGLSQEQMAPPVEAVGELRPAFVAVIRSLSMLERVVFVLHDGLDWSYVDIARLLDRSEVAVRQLRHRAKQHLALESPRFVVDPSVVESITTAFVRVSAGADVFELVHLLAPGLASPSPVFWCRDHKIVHDVAGIVLMKQDRLVLCRRRDDLGWYPGGWDVPGCHLRHGEPAIACAVRAAKQELDLAVTNPVPLMEHLEADYRLQLFQAVSWAGEPKNSSPDQHVEIGLFTRDQASRMPLIDRRLLTLFDRSLA